MKIVEMPKILLPIFQCLTQRTFVNVTNNYMTSQDDLSGRTTAGRLRFVDFGVTRGRLCRNLEDTGPSMQSFGFETPDVNPVARFRLLFNVCFFLP
jgi:hypothetical protein